MHKKRPQRGSKPIETHDRQKIFKKAEKEQYEKMIMPTRATVSRQIGQLICCCVPCCATEEEEEAQPTPCC
ncbi:MAG: hypothetical protein GY820_06705 [Gammaproteobacteria bacterium]|nr:hypothetical protein [Gammaproteobacteria bacterium]